MRQGPQTRRPDPAGVCPSVLLACCETLEGDGGAGTRRDKKQKFCSFPTFRRFLVKCEMKPDSCDETLLCSCQPPLFAKAGDDPQKRARWAGILFSVQPPAPETSSSLDLQRPIQRNLAWDGDASRRPPRHGLDWPPESRFRGMDTVGVRLFSGGGVCLSSQSWMEALLTFIVSGLMPWMESSILTRNMDLTGGFAAQV